MEMLIDVFTDAALDCIKMLPFLFLAFLLIEALEIGRASCRERESSPV